MSGARWPAAALARDPNRPLQGFVCATMWPTISLSSRERWFDELYLWTEGFVPSTMQRARLQLAALVKAFALLERERVRRIGVVLSFGTIERALEPVTDTIDAHRLVAHRLCVILRGQVARLRSPYRLRSFIEWLRAQQIPVGYRLAAARIGMEMRAIDFLAPDFAKLVAPASTRIEFWGDLALEARAVGLRPERMIVAALDQAPQCDLAAAVGFGFGQGHAVRAPYEPPATGLRAARDNDLVLD
ncbi:MAG: hypothetical protein N2688_04075 [Burkholderiaceae bacterium]|nr:hypothetical protein [Burkholderiaceae bacterium]